MIDTNWQQRPAAHLLIIKPLSFPQPPEKNSWTCFNDRLETFGLKKQNKKKQKKNGNIQVTDSDAVLARLDCRFNDRYYSDSSTWESPPIGSGEGGCHAQKNILEKKLW